MKADALKMKDVAVNKVDLVRWGKKNASLYQPVAARIAAAATVIGVRVDIDPDQKRASISAGVRNAWNKAGYKEKYELICRSTTDGALFFYKEPVE